MKRCFLSMMLVGILLCGLSGCAVFDDVPDYENPDEQPRTMRQTPADLPDIPDDLDMENGVPMLTVYDVQNDRRETMDIER